MEIKDVEATAVTGTKHIRIRRAPSKNPKGTCQGQTSKVHRKKNAGANVQTQRQPVHRKNAGANLQRSGLVHRKNAGANLQAQPIAPVHRKNTRRDLLCKNSSKLRKAIALTNNCGIVEPASIQDQASNSLSASESELPELSEHFKALNELLDGLLDFTMAYDYENRRLHIHDENSVIISTDRNRHEHGHSRNHNIDNDQEFQIGEIHQYLLYIHGQLEIMQMILSGQIPFMEAIQYHTIILGTMIIL